MMNTWLILIILFNQKVLLGLDNKLNNITREIIMNRTYQVNTQQRSIWPELFITLLGIIGLNLSDRIA